jgi:hypothetical protein
MRTWQQNRQVRIAIGFMIATRPAAKQNRSSDRVQAFNRREKRAGGAFCRWVKRVHKLQS